MSRVIAVCGESGSGKTTEEWRDVLGYEGLYQVSNLGRVKSIKRVISHKRIGEKTVNERILHYSATKYKHRNVVLSRNGIHKHKLIHRLVAEAFIHNPDMLPCVNHKDENPANNHVDNLEWCTYQYNNTYGKHAERIKNTDFKKMKSLAKPYTTPVIQIDSQGLIVNVWESMTEASTITHTPLSKICNCCRGLRKTSNGFIWRYKEECKCLG